MRVRFTHTNREDKIMTDRIRYYLINTMSAAERSHCGRVLSWHWSQEAAVRADGALQRATRRANGNSSYLPTIIRTSDEVRIDCADAWER